MFNFFIGLMFGASFGFLIAAMMAHTKSADERMELEQEVLADWRMKQVEREALKETYGAKKSS
jgi:hypothetical protein